MSFPVEILQPLIHEDTFAVAAGLEPLGMRDAAQTVMTQLYEDRYNSYTSLCGLPGLYFKMIY